MENMFDGKEGGYSDETGSRCYGREKREMRQGGKGKDLFVPSFPGFVRWTTTRQAHISRLTSLFVAGNCLLEGIFLNKIKIP
jgi:hypothetical protein